MNTTVERPRSFGHRFMLIAWLLIAAKCGLAAWAVARWNLPFAAGWVIWPTLAFASLATLLGWANRRN